MVVSDEAFAALARVAAESPESILDHRCEVATLLDHEVVTIRANAVTQTTEFRIEAARIAILIDYVGESSAPTGATAVPDAVALLEDVNQRG